MKTTVLTRKNRNGLSEIDGLFDDLMNGLHAYHLLFESTATRSLARSGPSFTRDHVLLNILDNVAGRIEAFRFVAGQWQGHEIKAPLTGTLSASSLHDPFVKDDPLANHYSMSYLDFLTPASLFLAKAGSDERELLKRNPTFFDNAGLRTEQRFATSKDGTKVPYFVVYPKGAKTDGTNPTVLYGYGGFQISMTPFYSGGWGTTWLQRGGVLVTGRLGLDGWLARRLDAHLVLWPPHHRLARSLQPGVGFFAHAAARGHPQLFVSHGAQGHDEGVSRTPPGLSLALASHHECG